MKQRIQKLLAHCGIGSRRKIESWIESGMVMVNGEVITPGTMVSINDDIQVNGRKINVKELLSNDTRVIIYNKPEGKICTKFDPEGRKTIYDDLPLLNSGRWVSVGRLDLNTSGLLLLTTNGELANRLMHPSYEIEREYAVRVFGKVSDDVLLRLKTGVEIDGEIYKFNSVKIRSATNSNHWYHVTLSTGRNREVRKLWESQDVNVSRLIRLRYGVISLPRWLTTSKSVELSTDEIDKLCKSVNITI
tara:strand:+ start:22362 stop:23102 length:741 start_codon:yes stop_codon:yes gene_type:complete